MSRSINARGFSLLEVLIVTAIMGVIAMVGSTAIKNSFQNKNKIDARLRTESMVFDALRLMATDIERAFHYQYALYEIDKQAILASNTAQQQQQGQQQQGQQQLGQQQPTPTGAANVPPPPERLTQFIGKEKEMHFTTLNHQRTMANSQESNQVEVGYYINTCKSRVTQKESQCLYRRSSTVIDNDVTRGGDPTALLENVSVFKLEYLNEDTNDKEWKREWISDNNGSAATQNMFPYMVKITLETEDKDSKFMGKFKQTVITSVRFTNNHDPAKKFAAGNNQGQQGLQQGQQGLQQGQQGQQQGQQGTH